MSAVSRDALNKVGGVSACGGVPQGPWGRHVWDTVPATDLLPTGSDLSPLTHGHPLSWSEPLRRGRGAHAAGLAAAVLQLCAGLVLASEGQAPDA